MVNRKILVIGGYGNVGSAICEILVKMHPDDIIVAGRNYQKANQLAKKLNGSAIPFAMDINDHNTHDDVLQNVKLVIVCIDQFDTYFVKSCIKHGVDYIDITASYSFISQVEKMGVNAENLNSSVILSVGLAPGLTNLMAKVCQQENVNVEYINIFILLGSGGQHGEAAYRWILNDINDHFYIKVANKEMLVSSLEGSLTTTIDDPLHLRKFYRANFSDQHVLPKTLQINSVSTYFRFDSKLVTNFFVFLKRTGLSKIFKVKWVQDITIKIMKLIKVGDETFFIKVVGKDIDGNHSGKSVILTGIDEAKVTASVAANLATYLLQNNVKSGVSHIEEVVEPLDFISKLDVELKLASTLTGEIL